MGNAALWNSCAFYPEYLAQESLNQMLTQFVVWMLRLGKRSEETWDEFRRRSVRRARVLIHRHLRCRWSTKWVERFWGYMGHVARGLDRVSPLASSIMNSFRDLEWWTLEQANPFGRRHHGRFRAKLGPYDGKMNSVLPKPWREAARDREGWRNACRTWTQQIDVPWCSGTQFAVEW